MLFLSFNLLLHELFQLIHTGFLVILLVLLFLLYVHFSFNINFADFKGLIIVFVGLAVRVVGIKVYSLKFFISFVPEV